ncbi:MAG: DUF116 domain-containing protein [Bacteroidota bacterium]
MTRIITYSLKPDTSSADEYQQAISVFADSWLACTMPGLRDLIGGFRAYRQSRGEADRSEAECAFELLALGVLLREHGDDAVRLPGWVGRMLARLVDLQNRVPQGEQLIKRLRGWLGWITGRRTRRKNSADLGQLLAWLEADGETIKQERLGQWHAYLQSKGTTFSQSIISQCTQLADAFASSSLSALGKYTENVERFRADATSKKRRRYDARLLLRTRLEYHLGMLGTELLNRAYRERFLATGHKMVILPPCMCAPAEKCKAVETPLGARCQACTPGCRVNQITKLGEKRGFGVTMIPDDVKVFDRGNGARPIGLVGVSCALTNWNGGWQAGALGIPAQGLLLDYAGCKFHWDKTGIPTDANLKRLQEILDV